MTHEMEAAYLRRIGFSPDGEVMRHPDWRGWVHRDELRRQWVAVDANRVDRCGPNLVDVLRRSGFRPVGVPA